MREWMKQFAFPATFVSSYRYGYIIPQNSVNILV